MTVAALSPVAEYRENGVTTFFAVPFRFRSPADLIVERIVANGPLVTLTLGVDYRVTGGATDAGGTLTRTVATNGATLRIRRRTGRTQAMVYATGDRFPAKSHEGVVDQLMLIDQEQDAAIADLDARSLTVPAGERPGRLPSLVQRAGRMLGFDALGAAIVVSYQGLAMALAPILAPFVKGDPGGNVESIGTFFAGMRPVIGAGTTQVATSGETRGRFIANPGLNESHRAAHPLAIFQAADGRYFRRDGRDGLWLEQFGGDPTAVEDSSPALHAVIAYAAFIGGPAQNPNQRVAVRINVGPGTFRLRSRINIKACIQLIGMGSWHELSNGGTTFLCDEHGLIFNRSNTFDFKAENHTFGSDGSIVEGIRFVYALGREAWNNTVAQAYGIHAQCAIWVRNCRLERFPCGLAIEASTDGAGPTLGEASQAKIWHNNFNGCLVGFLASGIDANIMHIVDNTFAACSAYGVISNNLIGNLYTKNHYKDCGLSDEWGVNIVTYQGSRWQTNYRVSTERLRNEAPGTSDAWSYVEPAYFPASYFFPQWPVDFSQRQATVRTYKNAGPVLAIVVGADNVFEHEYLESSQPRPVINSPSKSFHGTGVWLLAGHSTGAFQRVNSDGFDVFRGIEAGPFKFDPLRGLLFGEGQLSRSGPDWRFTRGNADAFEAARYTQPGTTFTGGRSAPQPDRFVFPELAIGGVWHGATDGVPPADQGGTGERRYLRNPVPGGIEGYVKTGSGWRGFGSISA